MTLCDLVAVLKLGELVPNVATVGEKTTNLPLNDLFLQINSRALACGGGHGTAQQAGQEDSRSVDLHLAGP